MRNRVYNYKINGYDYGYDGFNYSIDNPYADWYGTYGNTYGGSYNYSVTTTKQSTLKSAMSFDELKDIYKTESKEDAIIRKLAEQRMKIYTSHEEALADENRPDDCFYPARDGWGVLRTRTVDGNKVIFMGVTKECPLLRDAPTAISINIENKIPKELLQEIVASFYDVYKSYHKEASAQIWRKKDGDREYFVVYPEQKISGASVTFSNNTKAMQDLREIADRVVDCHSHHSMGAFWSTVDDGDEQTADCFRMVIGAMASPQAKYLLRIKYATVYTNFPATDLFDMTEEEEAEIFNTNTIPVSNKKIFDAIVDKDTASRSTTTVKAMAKANLIKALEGMDVVENTSELYKELWNHFSGKNVNGGRMLFSCGFKFVPASKSENGNPRWERISKSDPASKPQDEAGTKEGAPGAEEGAAKEEAWDSAGSTCALLNAGDGVDSLADDEKELARQLILGYTKAIGAVFCGDEITGAGKSTNSSTDVVDYLSGCLTYVGLVPEVGEVDPDKIVYPGEIGKEFMIDEHEDLDDEVIEKIAHAQATARVKAQTNIEEVMDFYCGDSLKLAMDIAHEKSFTFIQTVLSNASEVNFEKSFHPAAMWELLTANEKTKLANIFGMSVVDLSTAFGFASGGKYTTDGDRMSVVTALVLYKLLLMPYSVIVKHNDILTGDAIHTEGKPHLTLVNFNNYVKKHCLQAKIELEEKSNG